MSKCTTPSNHIQFATIQPEERTPITHSRTSDLQLNSQPQQNRETKRKCDGQCRHCDTHGHKWAECRKRLSEENQSKSSNSNSQMAAQPNQTQENKAKYNSKFVCQICGKMGHSARDCYYRNPTTSAYSNVPFPKQSTDENKQFRRDFRHANNKIYTANELSLSTTNETDSTEET